MLFRGKFTCCPIFCSFCTTLRHFWMPFQKAIKIGFRSIWDLCLYSSDCMLDNLLKEQSYWLERFLKGEHVCRNTVHYNWFTENASTKTKRVVSIPLFLVNYVCATKLKIIQECRKCGILRLKLTLFCHFRLRGGELSYKFHNLQIPKHSETATKEAKIKPGCLRLTWIYMAYLMLPLLSYSIFFL